ncbi:solute carrier family 66 member 2 isoform X2 [Lasioglossum baleicum]|uniref:solute carrier family 66 member 2 isoform X2 n=1 Tax=Lasioglossum baleicum TaxID=434251 RepID=UPI003FCCB926
MNNVYGELTIKDLANWLASGAIIFGGIIPYIPQYREIKRTEDAEGFSLYVCLTLLIANTLRIFFWFGKHYEVPLLLQSVFMIITMFIMIKLCVSVQNRNQIIKTREHVFADFQSYLDFMLLFAAVVGVVTYLLVDVPIFVEFMGLLAVLTEAMLGVPQFLRNFVNKSTSGMSIIMVTMWTLGDAFKTCYFFLKEAPIQFEVCGILQVIIDIAILAQVYIYQNSSTVHTRVPVRAD